jgi:RimJ/RimL family protein N-acetyltransferase
MTPIESPRLLIKAWTIADLPDALELWGDPRVMEFIDIRGGLNRSQVEQKLQQEIERQNKFGVQYWKVIAKETGEIVGCCGLRPYDLDRHLFEIGFHIKSKHWCKGYATEAAKAVIAHAFSEMKLPKLFAGHNPKNLASHTMLLKLGFNYIGDQFYVPTGLHHPSYELAAPNLTQ